MGPTNYPFQLPSHTADPTTEGEILNMAKRISIRFQAKGEGTLTADGRTYACLGQPGRQYPGDLTVTPSDKSLEHWSDEFQVLMRYCVLIWGQRGIYIHEGPNNLADNVGPSAGCIHLGKGDAKAVYDWIDERTRITIEYPWLMHELDVGAWNLHLRLEELETRMCDNANFAKVADAARASGTQEWSWANTYSKFGASGCSTPGCPFHGCTGFLCCALNLSEALIQAGYTLPAATSVNYCAHNRVRNADGMARICNAQNGGRPDASGWSSRPSWKGIVYFEGNLGRATGHVDLWDGTKGVHNQFPAASTIWFWKMGL